MKKILFILVGILCLSLTNPALAKSENASENANQECTTIQSGELLTSDNKVISTGFDEWGYNYQGKLFNGFYCDAYRDADWCQPYKEDSLAMKWSDAWLSNKDCDGDDKLDRHYGFSSYIGSGAWLTNHQSGTYEGENWNVVGTWKWLVLNTYEYDLVITSQDSEGNFIATGGFPAGFYPYTSIGQTPELITNGKVTGDK